MTATDVMHEVVSREEWLKARTALLEAEKALTRRRDELARQRRELPWVRVEQDYSFHGPAGRVTLADLFQGRSQLIVYHFMFGPDWEEGCPGCSFVSDHIDGMLVHLAHRDVSLVAVSRAPIDKIQAFRRRMGWRFRWVSSEGSGFNREYGVSFEAGDKVDGKLPYNYGLNAFPTDEAPGLSVFFKSAGGDVFHTYSCYARGLDGLVGTYNYLDLVPKGRDEDGLPRPMAWLRHHDRYEDAGASPCDCERKTA
ncbi:MAG: DUF899 domain-containing protein [Acidobacteria bacterium]|nr:DUF899 domain-containing protein [Acidobacteriota bacterium]